MGLYFFTKNEQKVFLILTDKPESVTCLAKNAKVPRTSTEKVLKRLVFLGFAIGKKVHNKKRHLYSRASLQSINEIVESFRLDLLGSKVINKIGVKVSEECLVNIYSGREGIINSLKHMLSIRSHERVYGVQGADSLADWVQYLGEKEVVNLHSIIKQNNIIIVSLRSGKLKKEVADKNRKIKESFKDRLSQSHSIPDKFFHEKLSIYVFKDTILFIDLKSETAIELVHKPSASGFLKLINFVLTKTDRDNLF